MSHDISATVSEKTGNKNNPFSLLQEREQMEAQRLEAAMQQIRTEETEAHAGIRDAERVQEEEWRTKAKEELIAEREAAAMRVRERRDTAEQSAQQLRAACEKKIPALAASLAEEAVDFFTAS